MLDVTFDERLVKRVEIRFAVESLYRFMECVLAELPPLEQNPHWRFEPAIAVALPTAMRFIQSASSFAAPALLAFDVLKVMAILSSEPAQDALLHLIEAFATFLA